MKRKEARQPELVRLPRAPEGFFISRKREQFVIEAYKQLSVLTRKERPTDCCKKHPEDPKIALFVEFENGTIVARVKASHACGIKKISVFIADKETAIMQPGDVKVDSYTPKLIGGGFVDTSVDVKSTSGRPVEKTLSLLANVPVDETFYVAAIAVSVCDTQDGDNEGPWVLV